MSKKRDLLIALKKGLDLEEDLIARLAPRCRDCILTSELSREEKREIENILSILESDSAKHKRVAEGLIKQLKTEEKDGYQKNTL